MSVFILRKKVPSHGGLVEGLVKRQKGLFHREPTENPDRPAVHVNGDPLFSHGDISIRPSGRALTGVCLFM